jgi:hypothetical protein
MLLFISGNNLIQVYSPAFKPADITLKSLDKTLRVGNPEAKGDTLSIMAMPFAHHGQKMRLAIVNNKTRKTIKTISFTCDSIPKLVARVGTISTNEAPKKTVLAQTVLKAVFPNSLYSYPYQIKYYTFKIATPTGSATLNIKGFFITKDVLQEISTAPEGTVIEFTNIKAMCPDCAIRPLNDIKIKMK